MQPLTRWTGWSRGVGLLGVASMVLTACTSAAPATTSAGATTVAAVPTAAAAAPTALAAAAQAAPTVVAAGATAVSAGATAAPSVVAAGATAVSAGATAVTGAVAAAGGADMHIAIVHPFTGKYAGVGAAAIEGASAAALEINDAGGIQGHKVVVDQVDTVGDPADAVPALNKELSVNKPVGVVGPGGLEIGALQPILDRNKVPFMLQAGNTAFDKTDDPFLWRANPSDSQLGVAMALYAAKKGYKKAVLMFSTIESAQTLKEPITATFTKQGGTIVGDVDLSPGQSSYRSEALKVINAAPDVIFSQMEPSTGAPLFSNFKELGGLTIPIIGSDITAGSDFVDAVTPAAAHDVLVSLEGADVSGAASDIFKQYYARLYTHQPLADANYAYDATIILALALTKAPAGDGTAVAAAIPVVASSAGGDAITSYKYGVAALQAGKKTRYIGASGPYDYNDQHNVFGDFDAVQADATSGKLQTIMTLSAADLKAATVTP
jgi:ABC-type branched-subunit amino acid transport system substrate-binding protein